LNLSFAKKIFKGIQ